MRKREVEKTKLTPAGMARIFTCVPGLVKLILGGQWSDTGLPECFRTSTERFSKMMSRLKQSG